MFVVDESFECSAVAVTATPVCFWDVALRVEGFSTGGIP
jgi:hypothetical protein